MYTDHLIFAVRDLDQAEQALCALGFTLTDRKTFTDDAAGLGNHLVYLDGIYLELMGDVDKARPTSLTPLVQVREGLAGIAVMGGDVEQACRRAHTLGFATDINEFEVHFDADGRDYSGRFRATRLSSPDLKTTWIQIVEELVPYDRTPFYLPHDNGAQKVLKTVFAVMDDTANVQVPVMLGAQAMKGTAHHWYDGAQDLVLLSAADFESAYGYPVDAMAKAEAIPSAVHIEVEDVKTAAAILERNNIDHHNRGDCLVISPQHGCGTVWVME